MNHYYVYGYSDPTSTDPYFYIGKGCGDRYIEHFKLSRLLTVQTHFYKKLKKLLSYNIIPNVSFIKFGLTEEESLCLEKELILKYGRLDLGTGCLCNHTDGGEGIVGLKHNDATKKYLSVLKKGQAAWNKGIETGQQGFETCLKKSESALKRSKETNEKIRQGQIKSFGRPVEAVCQITGKVIYTFTHLNAVKLKGFTPSTVSKILAGRGKYHGGYCWRYAE